MSKWDMKGTSVSKWDMSKGLNIVTTLYAIRMI